MTTYAPIQPRPILCKPSTTNNIQSSSIFLTPSSTMTNTNFYSSNTDFIANNSSQISSIPVATLSPYEEFLKKLREFHRGRQTSFRCLPTIAGQVVDLHLLYNTVTSHGGWDKVNDRQLWPTIANNFSIDSSCLNGTQALKNIYIRYLYAYEKISNGENIDSRDDENEDSKRRTVSQLQRVPQSYNFTQHIVSDGLRIQYGLFNDFVQRNEFEKLELALICGFPNELTFTLNTLLLLSSSPNHTKSFHLYKCPRLLDLLFRHAGLFLPSDTLINDHYLKTLYDDLWSKHINYNMSSFWIESCSPKILKLLLKIDVENKKIYPYKNFNISINENQREQEFRIEQILMIIRNLSFDRLNALFLIDTMQSTLSITYIFLLLISYSENKVELQKYAFDVWTNLALYMHLRIISNDEGLLFRQLLNSMLMGDDDQQQQQQDRIKIIRALEVICNLARAGSDNGIYLVDYVDIIVKSLIHIPDILVLVHSLECLYQLSELGEQLCDAILKDQSSTSIITTLIDLLTIEARSFSSDTIKTIKLIEMSSGPAMIPSYHQPPVGSQPIIVLSSNQGTQQHQIYPIENYDLNKPNTKIIIQQTSKPITLSSFLSSGNVLSVSTTPTQNPSTIIPNRNIQINDKKRKFDYITDSSTPSLTEILSAPKVSRPLLIQAQNPPNRILISEEKPKESNIIVTNVQSTIINKSDRFSSQPFENEILSCLNDLCQQVVSVVDQSITDINNHIVSPRFKRKIETSLPKETNYIDEQLQIKNSNQISQQKLLNENTSNEINLTEKKEELTDKEISENRIIVTNSNSNSLSTITTTTSDYVCDWDNCKATFGTARAVFHHTCSIHVKNSSDYVCMWNGCDRLKRQKWALINHIQERHCSEMAFRQAKLKLANPSFPTTANATVTSSNIPTVTNRVLASGSLGYTSDAAWYAIRRYMQANPFDDQINKSKEGPLTKSIRLTAALILRNIARHSSSGKQNLRQYEQIIANLALESSEASHTLSSCLFELCN